MEPYIPKNLPIKKIKWDKFISLIGPANASVARFDGLLQSMQDPSVLLSPLERQEAVLSSKIEGTQATIKDVLKYEASPQDKTKKYGDIQEILNYRRAMFYAISNFDKISLSLRLIREMHKLLLQKARGKNSDLGEFRKMQNWIGKPGCTMEQATYVPPSPHLVPKLMGDLENYFHKGEKDILVQLAIIHAQFEMIHPFLDGNGRLGRILMPLFLYHKKVLTSPMFYLSEFFEANREEYYDKLLNVSKNNDWEDWIEYFLNAVIVQSDKNIDKAKRIHELYNKKKDKIVSLTKSQYSINALDFLFCRQIFTSTQFIDDTKISYRTAIRIIEKLRDGKIIKEIRPASGSMPALYIFPKLLDIVK